jgi:hypothetical protein
MPSGMGIPRNERIMSSEEMTSTRASELLRTGKDPAEIYPEWEKWLCENYGQGLTGRQLDKVYGLAYDHGHSSGLEGVAEYFVKYADFAREIVNAS